MKKLFISAIALIATVTTFSQIGGGGKLGYDIYFGGTGIKTLSIGGFGTYELDNEILVRAGVQIGLPYKESGTYTASARDNFSQPQSIQVNGEYKVSTINIYGDGIKFFGNGDADDGGAYGLVGVGITIASDQTTYQEYDRSIYSVTGFTDEGEKATFAQPMIRAFLGYDLAFDSVHGFAELGLSIAASESNSRTGSTASIPTFFEIGAGVRF